MDVYKMRWQWVFSGQIQFLMFSLILSLWEKNLCSWIPFVGFYHEEERRGELFSFELINKLVRKVSSIYRLNFSKLLIFSAAKNCNTTVSQNCTFASLHHFFLFFFFKLYFKEGGIDNIALCRSCNGKVEIGIINFWERNISGIFGHG